MRDQLVRGRERPSWRCSSAGGRSPAAAWVRIEYAFELRHPEMSFRRALRHHDEELFVRQCGVVTHEHCEATMGVTACGHYFGYPVRDAFDAVTRLYDV